MIQNGSIDPFLMFRLLSHKFEIQDVLGTGKYSVVYLAVDVDTERQVVIKMLKPGRKFHSHHSKELQNFKRN